MHSNFFHTSSPTEPATLQIGDVTLLPEIKNGFLRSLGVAKINEVALRSQITRWLPWFDAYEGEVFKQFAFEGIEQRVATTVVRTRAISDPDAMFRERRDSSGDICFRNVSWDAEPVEASFAICLEPATAEVDGRQFTGLRYWFEYEGETPIHRLVDRQTWELGGTLDGSTILCRNWLTPPSMPLGKDTSYSTVGLDQWAQLLPGALWGRWSLLPSFDLQYGPSGVLLAWFDEVSLIRTVIESNTGEDALRVLDMHLFEQSTKVVTNAKTVLWCPDVLDETEALNLWTRVHDQEAVRARAHFNMPDEGAPALIISENVWKDIHFDTSYEKAIEVASEFGAEYVFIDPVWEHHQALNQTLDALVPKEAQKGTLLEKFGRFNMCATLDFEVADIMGGEEGLTRLCERATAKNVRLVSWIAIHASPFTASKLHKYGRGQNGIFAAKESGRHPDTGYTNACWTFNLNSPLKDKLREQFIGVCQRTGLAGYLWDSYCNLGWWQVDYSNGDMRPQFDHMGELYKDLVDAELYIMPEALVSFSNHSCLGLHGGDVYQGELLGYSYNTNISLHGPSGDGGNAFLTGNRTGEELFRYLSHKRVPTFEFQRLPREQWNEKAVARIKEVFGLYKQARAFMHIRTVLKDGAGVLWQAADGTRILWSYKAQPLADFAPEAVNLGSGDTVSQGSLQPWTVYRLCD